jgi:hypothetical protein
MKGQGALEYLMTYGWALLIIVVVGAALYALGILNPATYTQSRCTGFQYFTYQNQKFSTTDYTIEFLNGNSEVNITSIAVDGTTLTNLTGVSGDFVSPARKITVTGLNPPTKTVGDTFSSVVTITYNTATIPGIKDSGTCTGKVQ